jgi:hypothetical protein
MVESIIATTDDPDLYNIPPVLDDEHPSHGSIDITRPPGSLDITIEDYNGDNLDVYLRWKQHDYYHQDDWQDLNEYIDVTDGTYSFTPLGNDWIWGDTTYTWSVNVTDGVSWTNKTFTYTTSGSRYDVNNDNDVNFIDAGIVWTHRTTQTCYDGLFDVNQDGDVNFIDAGLTWVNRD